MTNLLTAWRVFDFRTIDNSETTHRSIWRHDDLFGIMTVFHIMTNFFVVMAYLWHDDFTGEEVSIDKQVACEECPRWPKMTEVACEKTEVAVC